MTWPDEQAVRLRSSHTFAPTDNCLAFFCDLKVVGCVCPVPSRWAYLAFRFFCMLRPNKTTPNRYSNWNRVAEQFPGKTGKQCRFRWYNYLRADLKNTPWSDSAHSCPSHASCGLF